MLLGWWFRNLEHTGTGENLVRFKVALHIKASAPPRIMLSQDPSPRGFNFIPHVSFSVSRIITVGLFKNLYPSGDSFPIKSLASIKQDAKYIYTWLAQLAHLELGL